MGRIIEHVINREIDDKEITMTWAEFMEGCYQGFKAGQESKGLKKEAK